MAKHWMKGIVKHPGALRAKAKRAGLVKGNAPLAMSAIKTLEHSRDPATRRQATLAETFAHARKG